MKTNPKRTQLQMRFGRRNSCFCVFAFLCCCVSAFAQSGGGYNIKKSTIDSGGGTVTGGAYRLTGTVGQHDAGPVTGGDYTLTGGFWSPTETAVPPDPMTPDPSGLNKCRFVSFEMPATGTEETAVRVRLNSLHHVVPPYTGGAVGPFTSFEGQVMWVGPPVQYLESSATGTPFYASALQCTPHYQDWSTVGLLHVTGSAIVPSSVYEVENVAASCAGVESSCTAVSAPLEIITTRWGDVSEAFNPPSTTTQPDLGDISAMVNKFRSTPNAPIKARVIIAGNDTNGNFNFGTMSNDFNFSHIAACVDAFRGSPYPFKMGKCAAGPGVCSMDSECTGDSAPPCNLYCP